MHFRRAKQFASNPHLHHSLGWVLYHWATHVHVHVPRQGYLALNLYCEPISTCVHGVYIWIVGLRRGPLLRLHQNQNLPPASSPSHSKPTISTDKSIVHVLDTWYKLTLNCIQCSFISSAVSHKYIVVVVCVFSVSRSSALGSMGDLDDSESSSDASEEDDQQDRRPVRNTCYCKLYSQYSMSVWWLYVHVHVHWVIFTL